MEGRRAAQVVALKPELSEAVLPKATQMLPFRQGPSAIYGRYRPDDPRWILVNAGIGESP